MARKPNYRFERFERDRAKAAKKAARLTAKKERAEKKKTEAETETAMETETVEQAPTDD